MAETKVNTVSGDAMERPRAYAAQIRAAAKAAPEDIRPQMLANAETLEEAADEIERLQRIERNRDMWKAQCERQAERLRSQGGAPEGWAHVPAIGTYVEADHPITCINPTKAFEVRFVNSVRGHWLVRGDNTCWFDVNSVKPATRENAIAAEEAAMLSAAPQPPEGGTGWGSSALSDVASERQRQISAEGWDAAHDDAHDEFEMSRAAAFYCLHTAADILPEPDVDAPSDRYGLFLTADNAWPENWSRHLWKKPKDARRNLVRAAALIIADIERLDRATDTPTPPGQDARTNDGSETDGSLNQSLPSALPRKDVEGADIAAILADDSPVTEADRADIEMFDRAVANGQARVALRDRVLEMVFGAKSCPLGSQDAINAIIPFVESEVSGALSAERSRVIEECDAAIRAVIEPLTDSADSAFRNGAIAALTAIRALDKDGGGAHG